MARSISEETAHRLGPSAIGLAVLCWASGNIFIKSIELSGPTIALFRLWLGFLFTAGAATAIRNPWWRSLKQSLPGGVMFALTVATGFTAVKHTSIVDASMIGSLTPLLVLCVAGPWFGERVGRAEVAWSAVALAGLLTVVLGSSGTQAWSLYGDFLALLSLVTWTGFFLYTKRARGTLGTMEYQSGVMLGAALTMTPLILVTGGVSGAPSGRDFLFLMMMVVVPGFAGHGLMGWAHRYVDVSVSSLLTLGAPIISAGLAAVLLDESLGVQQIVGSAVVVVALAGVLVRHRKLEAELVEIDELA